jgi:hypothetical protein
MAKCVAGELEVEAIGSVHIQVLDVGNLEPMPLYRLLHGHTTRFEVGH